MLTGDGEAMLEAAKVMRENGDPVAWLVERDSRRRGAPTYRFTPK